MKDLEANLLRRLNVGDLLHRSARRTPRTTALTCGSREITYAELDELAARMGNAWRGAGIQPGDVVAFLGLNSPEFVAAWFGAAAIGAVLLPLNALLRGTELVRAVHRARARAVVVDEALWPLLASEADSLSTIAARWFVCDRGGAPPGWDPISRALAGAEPSFPAVAVDSDAPSTLLFTSGTESEPKGVLNTHVNWYTALLSALADLELGRRQRPLLALPLFHVAGLYVLLATLATGATGVMLPRIESEAVLTAIERDRVNYLVLPATAYLGLLRVPALGERDLSGLRHCVVFQYLPGNALDRLHALVPQAEWRGYWGQSELTPLGAMTTGTDLWERTAHPDPIGRAHLPLEVRIVDAEDRTVPPGQVGELVVRGPSVMKGYFDDEERTEAAFQSGWHHTGDLAVADEDGFMYFVDRAKDVIKTGGENVSSQEVEEVIARLPAVAEVSVIGLPDPYWVESVAAVVVARQPITAEAVIAHCRAQLAAFKVPKAVYFASELPKSPSGKVLKRTLKARYAVAP